MVICHIRLQLPQIIVLDIEKYDVITLASSKYMVFEAFRSSTQSCSSTKWKRVPSLHHINMPDTSKIQAPIFELYPGLWILQVKKSIMKFGCLLKGD